MLLLINLMSSKRWFLTRKIRKSNMVFIQALMAVARAIPISRILLINKRERTILTITLTIETYRGVFVSSLAKKQVTKTLIKI